MQAPCPHTGKLIYFTPQAAHERVRIIRRRNRQDAHTYRCDHCGYWHIAANTRAERLLKRKSKAERAMREGRGA